MTRRLLRALKLPYFKIWGHPLGRLIQSRPPFACRMEEVLDAVAVSRCAIEVNGDPHRLDLEPRWIRAARERGIKFIVSTDAHSTGGLQNLAYGVSMARRGWLSRDEVLNTLDAEQFHAGRSSMNRVFVLSPANCNGLRARWVLKKNSRSDLALTTARRRRAVGGGVHVSERALFSR